MPWDDRIGIYGPIQTFFEEFLTYFQNIGLVAPGFEAFKREMSSEISGGTFEWTRPPDWPTQICQICVGQSGGPVNSNVPPEISLDISLLVEYVIEITQEIYK